MGGAAIEVNHGKVRLPSQAIAQGQLLVYFPGVGAIHRNVLGPFVLVRIGAHGETGHTSHEIVGQG